MKLALAISLAIVVGLAWQLSVEITSNHRQQNKIRGLTASLADRSRRENLELQEKCALQAERMFRMLGYKAGPQNGNVDNYQSHYNAKLNKCFMAVDSTDVRTSPGTVFINRLLFDAYEQKVYAEYTWMSDKVKKYWEVPPVACRVIPSSGSEQLCNSEDEYKAFVARYME